MPIFHDCWVYPAGTVPSRFAQVNAYLVFFATIIRFLARWDRNDRLVRQLSEFSQLSTLSFRGHSPRNLVSPTLIQRLLPKGYSFRGLHTGTQSTLGLVMTGQFVIRVPLLGLSNKKRCGLSFRGHSPRNLNMSSLLPDKRGSQSLRSHEVCSSSRVMWERLLRTGDQGG